MRFAGPTGAILQSHNVATVARNSAGSYTVTFQKALASSSHCATVLRSGLGFQTLSSGSTGSLNVATYNTVGSPEDPVTVSVNVMGADG